MHIRLADENDAADIQAIYAPEVIETPITFETEPPSVDEIRRRLRETLALYPWLACEADGSVVGYAYATSHRSRASYRWSVDVSVYNHRGARGVGIGRALYTALLAILPVQGFVKAYAGITLPNPGSVGLHESMGFRPVGVYRDVGYKLGAWRDVGWWDLALQAAPAAPGEPLPLPQVAVDERVAAALRRANDLLRRR
jgi:L-amino acid N-acyltransferase YncA